jgi:hypothetical protein
LECDRVLGLGAPCPHLDKKKEKQMTGQKANQGIFEIIEESEVQFAKRGRKSNIDQTLVENLKSVKKNQRIAFRSFRIESDNAQTIKTEKARLSAHIRAAAKAANWESVSIKWTVDNTPTAMRS